jgi:hypothetical protein
VEIPAYERWFSSEFGAQLTELRELQRTLQDHEFVADQLGWCEMCLSEKLPEVFAELMQRLKDGTLHAFEPPRPDGPEDGAADDFEEDADDDIFDDFDEAFKEAFDSFFGFSEDAAEREEDEFFGKGGLGLKHLRREPLPPEAAAIKALYRTLAKRLHPDHSKLEEVLRERRWHELQQAYDQRDLEALQRIEAVCDMEDAGGLSIRLGLARLRDLAAYQRSHVQPIRNALREAKRHPAFNFSQTDKTRLRKEGEFDIAKQRQEQLERLEWLREMFAEFAEDIAEDAAPESGANEPVAEDGGEDFWDSYTAWRDEELSHQAGR